MTNLLPSQPGASELADFYQTLFGRRDVRSEFLNRPIAAQVLARILTAAHHAPSVGLSQPWKFLLVEDVDKKRAVHAAFQQANTEAVEQFSSERRDLYRSLKLQGILDAPINILVTCDRQEDSEVVLGRTHQPEMDLYSTVCAVQNLWLSARAEGVGVGWVSIISPEKLLEVFGVPQGVVPIAYLCLGYVSRFRERPELEEQGWGRRMPIEELVFNNTWGKRAESHAIFQALADIQDWPIEVMSGAGEEGEP